MIRNWAIIVTGLLLFTASTCEQGVDLGLEEQEPYLVVESNFTVDQFVEVNVTRSQGLFDPNIINFITNAVVELFQGDTFIERLDITQTNENTPPFYTTKQFKPEENIIYTIKVSAPGFEPVEAMSVIPPLTKIEAFEIDFPQVRPGETPNSTSFRFNVRLAFTDPPNPNFYHLRFFQQIISYNRVEGDTILTGTDLREINFTPLIDNNYMTVFFDGGVLIEDGPFDGQSILYTFPLQVTINPDQELLGKVFVDLLSVSEEYYRYYNSLSRQLESGNGPFTEPVIIDDNVDNGGGIFAGFNTSRDSVSVF